MIKVWIKRWLNISPEERYKLFCDGTITLSDVKNNPIIIAYATNKPSEIDLLKRLRFTNSGQTVTNDKTQEQVWRMFVQLDLSID